MTSTVKNIKVGNTSYPVQDTKATPFLSSTDESTLLSNGTYRGETVANNTIFTSPSGALEKFVDTVGSPTATWSQLGTFSSFRGILGYAEGHYIAVSSEVNATTTSTDGVTWTALNTTFPYTNKCGAVCHGNGRWVAVNRNDIGAAYSDDNGVTWVGSTTGSKQTSRWSTDQIIHVVYFKDKFVCAGSYQLPSYSLDGDTWVLCSVTTGQSWPSYRRCAGLCELNGVLYWIDFGNRYVMKSTDGITWSVTQNVIPSGSYYAAGSNGSIMVAITTTGTVWTEDGTNWFAGTGVGLGGAYDGYCLWTGSYFYVNTRASTVNIFSYDGKTWYSLPALNANKSVVWDGSKLVAINSTSSSQIVQRGVVTASHTYSLDSLSYTASEVDEAIAEVNEAIAEIPSWLTGVTDPTTSTKGSVGQRYLNTVSGSTFICSGAEAPIANYTVNGSPTIDSDYVMSGIGASNYITGPSFSWATSTSSKWSMEMEFTTPSAWTQRQHLWAIGTVDNLGFIYNGTLIMALTAYGVVWNDTSYGVALSTSTHYKVKWEYTGSAMNMYVTSTDTYPSTPSVTKAQTGTISAANIFFGCRPSYSDQYYRGSIDLKSIKIYSDGTLVWEAVTENYGWEGLQNKLTAGTNITIDSNNVISATGGGSSASYDATTQEITL